MGKEPFRQKNNKIVIHGEIFSTKTLRFNARRGLYETIRAEAQS